MPLLLLLALLVPIAPPAVHGQGTAACHASDSTSLQACLADPAAADPDTAFEIVLDGDITLGVRERIVVQDKHNLVIRAGATAAVISETVERMESSGGNNRYLMLVSGGSGVTLRNVAIRDPAGSDLSARCRAGADPDRPNRWEKGPCEAPLTIDGGATGVVLDGVEITSHKAILLELREVDTVLIVRSAFREGSVFGVFFNQGFTHHRVTIAASEFTDIGANALVVHNAAAVTVAGNRFVDNHRDRQFESCGVTGSDPCSGGQILVRDQRDRPVVGVEIVGNLITQTDPERKSAVGIEVGNADFAPLLGIRIVANHIEGLGRQAIQVHRGRRPGGHVVLIAYNRVTGNGLAFDRPIPMITINENTGVITVGHDADLIASG